MALASESTFPRGLNQTLCVSSKGLHSCLLVGRVDKRIVGLASWDFDSGLKLSFKLA